MRVSAAVAIQLLEPFRDAEVEELHLAVDVDQHVRRLQIAMDHQAAVRVFHGRADLAEQMEPRLDVERLRVAVAIDRRAVDEFHHEIRQASAVTPLS